MKQAVCMPDFVKSMGHQILGYILNVSDAEARAVLEGGADLCQEQTEVLREYVELCRDLRSKVWEKDDLMYHFAFGRLLAEKNRQRQFAGWRIRTGGQTIDVDRHRTAQGNNPDRLILALSMLARDTYPLFLIRLPYLVRRYTQPFLHTYGDMSELLDCAEACSEALRDPLLQKMFSRMGVDTNHGTGYFATSTGQSRTIELKRFPSTILATAYQAMRLEGLLSQEDFVTAISQQVNVLRSVAEEGGTAEVPAYTGFHNVALGPVARLELDAGSLLCACDERHLEFVPDAVRRLFSKEHPGVVMKSGYTYRASFGRSVGSAKSEEWRKAFDDEQKALTKLQDDLSLSFAFSIDRKPPVGVAPAWTVIIDPLIHWTNITWSHWSPAPVSHFDCTMSDCDSVKDWYSTIHKTDDQKIRIAVRRLLLSINDRSDPIDGFIDAVIAWENLFGANAELTFRISGAMARLLGKTYGQRLDLFKKIKTLYDSRSKVVHGELAMSREEAVQKRDEAASLAVDCFRALYKSRTDLIDVKSDERSKRLILENGGA